MTHSSPPPGSPDLDLSTQNTAGSLGGAVFQGGTTQQDPTSQFNTIVRIQDNGVESGYNSDHWHEQYDEQNNHRHSLLLANIPIVIGDGSNGTLEGVAYRQFVLNINDPSGSKRYLSLDELQIWQGESGNLTNFTPDAGFAGPHVNHLAYDLDAGGDNWVGLVDYTPSLSSVIGSFFGHQGSEYSILIPDSYFINDTDHRYVTLYSSFGVQSGWRAEGGFEEWGVTSDYKHPGTTAAINATKTASVAGGTADQAGEVISYSITIYNVGDKTLTGISVNDPLVSSLVRNADISGDNDNLLEAGETWSYSAQYVVTQADLDNNGTGGSGVIANTVTVDSNETGPVTASTSVVVEQTTGLDATKTATVADGTADAAGDQITYLISVSNTGSATLTNPHVDDSMVTVVTPIIDSSAQIVNPDVQFFVGITDGDFNLGDTNQNGTWDAGETFQYVYPGDIDANGIHDPGETWTAINLGDANNDNIHQVGEVWAGDSNQNGVEEAGERWLFKNLGDTNGNRLQDAGETWQYVNGGDDNQNGIEDVGETFFYANAGDTDQDGVQDPGETWQYANAGDTNRNGVEDPGETFQYSVSHAVPGVDVDNNGVNDGDTNANGQLDVGETWQFAFTHTLTQDEIDNGGVVDPGLSLDNTATATTDQATRDATASVPVVQDPDLAIVKSADVSSVDEAGDVIGYTVTVDNTGNMTLSGLAVTDAFVTDLAYVSGDTDSDGKLDVDETWTYAGSHTVTQDEIDNGGVVDPGLTIGNTASADSDQTDPESASASVAVIQNPDLAIVKTADVASVDGEGDVITYTVTVDNTGNMSLTNVSVTDPFVSLAYVSGDTDGDDQLDVDETWTYGGTHAVTQAEIDAGVSIDNTASADSDQTVAESDGASVAIVQNASVTLDKTGTWIDGDSDGFADAGETVEYAFSVTNDGNVTLDAVALSDTLLGGPLTGPDSGDADSDGLLDVGETWLYSADHILTQAQVDAGTLHNDATVTAEGPQAQPATATDAVDVTLPQEPVAQMSLDKSDLVGTHFVDSDENGVADPDPGPGDSGDLIQYIIVLTNTGDFDLHDVVVDDPLLGGDLGAPQGGIGDGILSVGETWTWDLNYFITAADAVVLNGGGAVHNEATASALDPSNNLVTVAAQWDQFF